MIAKTNLISFLIMFALIFCQSAEEAGCVQSIIIDVELSARETSIEEGSVLTLTVDFLGGRLNEDVSFPLVATTDTNDNTVDAESNDYILPEGSMITVKKGKREGTFRMAIADDALREGTEHFIVGIMLPENPPDEIDLDQNIVLIQIIDEDVVNIDFLEETYKVDEGSGNLEIDIILSKALGEDESINLEITPGNNGGAEDGIDYDLPEDQRMITISGNSTTEKITLTILDNSELDSTKSFTLGMDLPEEETLPIGVELRKSTTIIEIRNDDLITIGLETPSASVLEEDVGKITLMANINSNEFPENFTVGLTANMDGFDTATQSMGIDMNDYDLLDGASMPITSFEVITMTALTFFAGDVSIVDDLANEAGEEIFTVSLELLPGTPGYVMIDETAQTLTFTIIDSTDPPAAVSSTCDITSAGNDLTIQDGLFGNPNVRVTGDLTAPGGNDRINATLDDLVDTPVGGMDSSEVEILSRVNSMSLHADSRQFMSPLPEHVFSIKDMNFSANGTFCATPGSFENTISLITLNGIELAPIGTLTGTRMAKNTGCTITITASSTTYTSGDVVGGGILNCIFGIPEEGSEPAVLQHILSAKFMLQVP